MRTRIIPLFALVISMLGSSAFGQDDVAQRDRAEIARMKADIGKTFWIEKPNGKGIELCPSPKGRFKECKYFANTSFRVQSVDVGEEYSGIHAMRLYGVRLADGRTGFVSGIMRSHFYTRDPEVMRKEVAAECERRGQPKIGMTASQAVETCWGKPSRVVKKTTADGIYEDHVYSLGHVLRFKNGVLAEIIETAGR